MGIGTLYRHFPNRQALLEAVYVDEVSGASADGRPSCTTPANRFWNMPKRPARYAPTST